MAVFAGCGFAVGGFPNLDLIHCRANPRLDLGVNLGPGIGTQAVCATIAAVAATYPTGHAPTTTRGRLELIAPYSVLRTSYGMQAIKGEWLCSGPNPIIDSFTL